MIPDYLNGLAGQLLDILHICLFLNVAEGKRPSSQPGAPCTADSVDIGLRDIGQVEIDDAGQFLDINAPGGYIRGNKDTETARFKIAEGGLSGALGFVPVDGGGSYTGFIQIFGPPVRAVLGAGEYQGGGHILVFQQMHKQGPFVSLIHIVEGGFNQIHGGGDWGYLHLDWVVQQLRGQGLDFIRHGGGEQQGLALLRQQGNYTLYIVDEPHVQHAVGLVQHKDFHKGQIYFMLAD